MRMFIGQFLKVQGGTIKKLKMAEIMRMRNF